MREGGREGGKGKSSTVRLDLESTDLTLDMHSVYWVGSIIDLDGFG